MDKKTYHYSIVLSVLWWYLIAIGTQDCVIGVDNISDEMLSMLKKSRSVGLITNQTGKNGQGMRTVDVLCKHGVQIAYIFAPEHGFEGVVQAGNDVRDSYDIKTKIPIVSLYSLAFFAKGTKTCDHEKIKQVDMLIFDIQDSGMRHYTYISTLLTVMKAAAVLHKPVVVFDRPNPLGGRMEGPLVDPSCLSFISIASIPVRHGMTIGELARYFNTHVLEKPALLYVIPLKQYHRVNYQWHISAPLSPNIQTTQSAYGYSFLGLLGEIKPFDIGIGTPLAFQYIGLPDAVSISPKEWKTVMNKLRVCGVEAVPYDLMVDGKKRSSGIKISISQVNECRSFTVLCFMIQLFKQAGVSLEFSHLFDKAIGIPDVRAMFQYKKDTHIVADMINKQLHDFYTKAHSSFLYHPFPRLCLYSGE